MNSIFRPANILGFKCDYSVYLASRSLAFNNPSKKRCPGFGRSVQPLTWYSNEVLLHGLDTEMLVGLESGNLACLAARSTVNTDRVPGHSGPSHWLFFAITAAFNPGPTLTIERADVRTARSHLARAQAPSRDFPDRPTSTTFAFNDQSEGLMQRRSGPIPCDRGRASGRTTRESTQPVGMASRLNAASPRCGQAGRRTKHPSRSRTGSRLSIRIVNGQ